jgi:hypothetical protein
VNKEFINILVAIGVAIGFAAFGFGFLRLHINLGKSILTKWAQEHGFQIVHSKRAFWTGAFNPFTTGRSQVVFLVTVKDREGRKRSGWVRCGSFLGGVLFSDQAEVIWQ